MEVKIDDLEDASDYHRVSLWIKRSDWEAFSEAVPKNKRSEAVRRFIISVIEDANKQKKKSK